MTLDDVFVLVDDVSAAQIDALADELQRLVQLMPGTNQYASGYRRGLAKAIEVLRAQ